MITSDLKTNLNKSFKEMISHIILNSSIRLDEFHANVEDEILSIEFDIPLSIDTLRKIEFFQDKKLLSECSVFVPVTGDTLFKYRVEVK
ncbi:hypothetical protein EQ871_14625 [Enterococcus casseliflavus]|uniref:hypothetical protein n=1 Tax=Enterococcus casseliflavus TaxID=37734 RepID=UPI000FFB09B4|nr:hypothetical protein [Enterococcus casseliflavus]RXA60310.1 hypothetical protein EQ871_14625 [Enterococcus casseliflavus]